MSTEIPIWVNGKIRWLSGIDKKTTCKDVVEVLIDGEGLTKSEAKDYKIMERWRKVERQLDENSKILKIWTHWGNEKKEVRLCLRRIEVDSGRGSPVGKGYIPSVKRKRNRIRGTEKPPWAYKETLHPRRLAELDIASEKEYAHAKTKESEILNDCEYVDDITVRVSRTIEDNICDKTTGTEILCGKKPSRHKSYHCSGTGILHSTPFSNSLENHSRRQKCCSKRESKQRVRNSKNIEKLMKLILAQGATIQNQLQKLKEREEQIELLEQERHLERVEKNGRNYLLETYLGSLKDAEIPEHLNDTENENETEIKAERQEKTKFNEAETTFNKSSQKHGKALLEEGNPTSVFKGSHKSSRSKSESRAQEGKLEENLKRTCSDNALVETNCMLINQDDKIEVTSENKIQNTKDELEDVVELRRIQSQIEMWEKVFRINKKLEKEEENLVRLHIKIKKIHSENYKVAKEKTDNSEKENSPDTVLLNNNHNSDAEVTNTEKMQYEQDCAKLEKNLESLKSDLENNSKEIYKNFTKLIEEDEIVAQKRSCLSKIMTDLERTNHEHDMLNEMIAMRKNQDSVQDRILPFCQNTNNFLVKNTSENLYEDSAKVEETNRALNPLLSQQAQVNQNSEVNVEELENSPLKPKIVKISFEDKVENYESLEDSNEKILYKSPITVQAGALKSILKNRRNGFSKKCNLNNEFQNYQVLPQNCEERVRNDEVVEQKHLGINSSDMQKYILHINDVSDRINSSSPFTETYPLQINYPHENSQFFNRQLPKISENFKNSHPPKITRTPFSHRTSSQIKTNALIHNDTDSSTSSDTSGLSSMYSSSTNVEEPYAEKNYVLDTLV